MAKTALCLIRFLASAGLGDGGGEVRALALDVPAIDPQLVAGHVRALSGQDLESEAGCAIKPCAAATIARYLVNIGWAYRMAGLGDPTAAPLVQLEHKVARKALGTR